MISDTTETAEAEMQLKYTKLWLEDLKPISTFCQQNRGAMSLIHQEWEAQTGETISRTQIERWIAGRSQPLYGKGKLLVEVSKKVMAREKNKK